MRGPDKVVPFERTTHTIHCMAHDFDFAYSKKVEKDGYKCEYWSNGKKLGVVFYTIEELKAMRELGIIDDSKLRQSKK